MGQSSGRVMVSLAVLLLSGPIATGAEDVLAKRCRSVVQGRIDVLDAQLHKGDQPNVAQKLLKRREKLKAQLEACANNPGAYKKDI